ncbi:MAG TPA: hypothetical protein VGR84_01975 [Candidatus Acidoferrales bacterium]|nr:hypothetical protein [Candidatus Acidoferrales bacterium]
MRSAIVVVTIICGLFAVTEPGLRQNSVKQQDSCAVVKEALNNSLHFKVGMTRREVEKYFSPDGGLQFFSTTGSTTRYVYLKCEFIKVNVSFKSAVHGSRNSRSPDDIVESVSKPYLEYPVAD